MNKKWIVTSLLGILFLGGFLRFYKLDVTAFDRDEFFEINSSYGYYKTGNFEAWDFNWEKPFEASLQDDSSNERAESYRWQLAQLYRFFEPSEALTRGLSAFWGIIGIVVVFFVTLSFTGNIYIALIAAFIASVGESGIIFSRRLRMYSMLFPVYLSFSWALYKFYESGYRGKTKIFQYLYDKLGVNPNYLFLALALGLLSYNIHALTINAAIAILIYAGIMSLIYFYKKSFINKYTLTILGGAAGFLVTYQFFPLFFKALRKRIGFIHDEYDYFFISLTDYLYPVAGILLFVLGGWYLWKKMGKGRESLFLFLSYAVPIAMAVFTWKREAAHRYIYFVQSFVVILGAAGVYAVAVHFYGKFKKYYAVAAVLLLFVLSLDFSYAFGKNSLYKNNANSFYPDFRKAFFAVMKKKMPEDVMITRTYRGYYWRGEKMVIYDTKKMPFDKKNCVETLKRIVQENKSGWVVLPRLDSGSICKEGRKFIDDNFLKVEPADAVRFIDIYRWDN